MKLLVIVLAIIAAPVTSAVPSQAQTKQPLVQPTVVAGFTLGGSCDIDARLGELNKEDGSINFLSLPIEKGTGLTEKDVNCKNGKIESVILVFTGGSFEAQFKFLQQKYGPATWITRRTEQNGFGATRSNNDARWNLKNGDSIIEYENGGDPGEDSLPRYVQVIFNWRDRLNPPPNSKSPY
jgi:hypothetical protein